MENVQIQNQYHSKKHVLLTMIKQNVKLNKKNAVTTMNLLVEVLLQRVNCALMLEEYVEKLKLIVGAKLMKMMNVFLKVLELAH